MNKSTDSHRLIWKKVILTMKFVLAFFIAGHITVMANDYSHNEKLSLKLEQATFDEIVSAIEHQSDYVFFYRSSDVDHTINYDVDLENRDAGNTGSANSEFFFNLPDIW